MDRKDMIVCCGEALIDFLPVKTATGDAAFQPFNGGSLYNVAVALGRLKARVAFLGGLSTDFFGRQLRNGLIDSGVDVSLAIRADRPSSLAFVDFSANEPEYAFVDEGSAGRMLRPEDIPPLPESVSCLHFGSISLIDEPQGATFERLAMAERDRRVMTFDPNIRPSQIKDRNTYMARFNRLVGICDLIKLSDADMAWLAPGKSPEAGARGLLEGGARLVVITRGERGALALSANIRVSCPAVTLMFGDTVGAGDTYMAALLAFFQSRDALTKRTFGALAQNDIAAALHFGARAAAITVSRRGANPPWADELETP